MSPVLIVNADLCLFRGADPTMLCTNTTSRVEIASGSGGHHVVVKQFRPQSSVRGNTPLRCGMAALAVRVNIKAIISSLDLEIVY